jgi:hypothetical protein
MKATMTANSVPPSYEEVVQRYNLAMLMAGGDWSFENGDLTMTKDGDIQHGDIAYSSLHRLVEMWRYNEPHLRYLFETANEMLARGESLRQKTNAIGQDSIDAHGRPDFDQFAAAFNAIREDQGVATFGAATYSGCLMIVLSGALLRFKDDNDAKDEWDRTEPCFNTHSVGAIIAAAANGFRHADEWAKTRPPTKRQKASQDIINGALSGLPAPDELSPGRCAEVIHLLSGGDFERLASNVFTFAHNLACKIRSRGEPTLPEHGCEGRLE